MKSKKLILIWSIVGVLLACACGVLIYTLLGNKHEHDMSEWIQTVSPTCTEQGEERRDCKSCDYFETRKVDTLGHNLDDSKYLYTKTTHYFECSRCHTPMSEEAHKFTLKGGTKCSVCTFENVDTTNLVFGTPNEVEKTIAIVGNNGLDTLPKTLVIPDYYNGYAVTEISDYAFSTGDDNTNSPVEEIILGNNIKKIGISAFFHNSKITEVVLPDSLEILGNHSFRECTNLQSVTLNDKLENVGYAAFYMCTNLTNLNLGQGNLVLSDFAFSSCPNIANITGGDNIVDIAEYTFSGSEQAFATIDGYKYLKNNEDKYIVLISAPSSVSNFVAKPSTRVIARDAFRYNTSLTSIDLQNVVTICDYAFASCSNLNTIRLGNALRKVKTDAFYSCSNIQSVYATSIEAWLNINFEVILTTNGDYFDKDEVNPLSSRNASLMIDDTVVTELNIPDSVTEIYPFAFAGYSKLESIHFGRNVEKVGDYAFAKCSGLTTIDISGNNEYFEVVNNCVVDNATKTLRIVCVNTIIPDGVKVIPDNIFNEVHLKEKNIIIPDSVEIIGSYAFSSVGDRYNITMGTGIKSIGYWAFIGFTPSLVTIKDITKWALIDFEDIEANPIKYESSTAVKMDGLVSTGSFNTLTLPPTVTEIKPWAFARLFVYTLNIPDETLKIDSTSFAQCSGLTEINIGNNPNYELSKNKCGLIEKATRTLVTTCDRQVADYSEDNIEHIGAYAGYHIRMVTVKLPSMLKTIGAHAFEGSNISTITLGESLKRIEEYAFRQDNNMSTIHFPSTLEYIGLNAFDSASGLSSAEFEDGTNWQEFDYWGQPTTVDFTNSTDAATHLKQSSHSWSKVITNPSDE